MRYVFIVNPFAGSGDSEALIREAVNNSKHTDECEIYLTKAPEDATKFVREYPTDEETRFIARYLTERWGNQTHQ